MSVEAPPAGTTEARVRAAAMGFGEILGRLTGLGPQAEAVFDQAASAFTEFLTPPIRAQATDHLSQLESTVGASAYAASVLDGWADDVAWYTAQIAALEADWDDSGGGTFGVRPPELSPTMSPEQRQQLLAGYDDQVAAAREVHLTALNYQAQVAYDDFLARAQERARQLTQGPTDANVAMLVAAGSLGWVAPTLWPSAPLPPLSAADGTDQATHLLALLSDPNLGPDQTALATVDSIDWLLSRALADPASVTPGQLDFLTAFYAELGGRVVDLDDLFARPRSDDTLVIQYVGGAPVAASDVTAGAGPPLGGPAQAAAVAALANGLMLLSNEKYGGGLGRIPPTVVQMVQDTPTRVPYNGLAKGTLLGTDFGQSAATTSFLAHSTIPAGVAFSRELAVAAADYLEALHDGTLPAGSDDSTAKELLWLIGRNPDAAHDAVTGANMPAGFDAAAFVVDAYTQPWSDDGTAVSRLTDWIPAAKGSGEPASVDAADETVDSLVTALTVTGPTDSAPFTLMLDAARENPRATQALGLLGSVYLDEMSRSGDHATPSTADWQRFVTLLMRDEDTARALSVSMSAFAQQNLALQVGADPMTAGAQNGQLVSLLSTGAVNSALQDEVTALEAADRLTTLLSIGIGGGGGLTTLLPTPFTVFTGQVFLAVLDGTLPVADVDPVLPDAVVQVDAGPNNEPIFVRPTDDRTQVEQELYAAHDYLAAAIPAGLVDVGWIPPELVDEQGHLRPLAEVDPAAYTPIWSALTSATGAQPWQVALGDYLDGYLAGVKATIAPQSWPEWQRDRDSKD